MRDNSKSKMTNTALPCLAVASSEASATFGIISIVARAVMVVTIQWSIMRVLWRLHDAGLVVIENYVSHSLEGHLDPLALLQHIVHLFQPWHRLGRHAYTLVFVSSLSVNFGEFRDPSGSIGHLSSLAGNIRHVGKTNLVERRL
jgi:hypothetical protein